MLIVRSVISFSAVIFLIGGLMLGPTWLLTGGLDWPRGWSFILVYSATTFLLGTWLYVMDPGLLTERITFSLGVERQNALSTIFLISVLSIWCLLIPIDVHFLKVLPDLPGSVGIWLGLGLFCGALGLIIWTFDHNSFASIEVKLQVDRGQVVIDTGPYAFVRHPLYAAFIPYLAGTALFLGSPGMALIAVPLVTIALLPRILTEEAALERHLEGYNTYTSEVKWRLLPRVF